MEIKIVLDSSFKNEINFFISPNNRLSYKKNRPVHYDYDDIHGQ
ncbi:hypothetical protein DERF_013448 [Dermatophagoides farinae]|uniref:Uncharacterized protein n=1 Tax=Dermatophagoides farinae TaxID=6954 RepID=A0A922HPI0_DERFA|nr:hypothetical protein DERF_013448 [Dermatophagoides farinae]